MFPNRMPKDVAEVERYVQNNMFPLDMNAVQPIMPSLQASKRYVGLVNIGNSKIVV